jgi:hypothetical protein
MVDYVYNLCCPKCNHSFGLDEPYLSADCPACGEDYYFWDSELIGEETVDWGYVWNSTFK